MYTHPVLIRPRRTASTRVELLAAVQKIREAANRIKCTNNLKQFGLPRHYHNDTYRFLPSGGWDWSDPPTYVNGSPAAGFQHRTGWGFHLLPFVEADATSRGGQATTDLERIKMAIGTPNSVFFCPSRRAPQAADFIHPDCMGGLSARRALCDYAGSNLDETGAINRNTPGRLADLTDGTKSTMLIGEKWLNRANMAKAQSDDILSYTAGFDPDTMRRTERAPKQDFNGAPSDDGDRRFGSSHPGRFNAVLADGSVRGVSYSIDPAVFKRLGSRSDGELVSDGDC
jgi:prepilin-type processing-associated H-X9-DG protein